MKKTYLFPLILLFTIGLFAQDSKQKIADAVNNRDYSAAILELKNLEASDKKLFLLNNYDYLLARMAEKRGDSALAMAKYQTVVKRNSVLGEYALWHISQIYRSSGNLMMERMYLQQVTSLSPNSLLKNAVNARIAHSSFESGDFEAVIKILSAINPATPPSNTLPNPEFKDTKMRENLTLLGKSYLKSDKPNEAREIFNKLISNLPNPAQPDDFALEAVKGLDEIEVGKDDFGKKVSQISDVEHFARASIYQFNRNFALARLHFMAIIDNFPNSTSRPVSLFQIGRGFALENSYNEAIIWFERLQNEFPENPLVADAINQCASAYSKVNKPKEAIARYQKFIQYHPEADNLERAFLNIVDIERDLGESSDALKWTQKTREAFAGKLPEAIAVFAQARIHIAENNWVQALETLDELQKFGDLGGTRVPSGTNKNEVAFLRAYTLEQLSRYPEAIEAYLTIVDGRGEYYGWRSSQRLQALALDEKSKPFVNDKFNQLYAIAQQNVASTNADSVRQAAQSAFRLSGEENIRKSLLEIIKNCYALLPNYQKIPSANLLEFGRKDVLQNKRENLVPNHQNLADELLFLGLYDEGTPELETHLREKLAKNTNSLNDFPADTAYTLAVFYGRGDMANRSIAYVEPQWRTVPIDYQIELIPFAQISLLYPAPYADLLDKYAPPHNVDPRFALSIMRQESRYRADIKSYAAARGLMQFISDTSNKIAKELGKENFQQDDLYNPSTAILFGSQYLGNLFGIFPAEAPAVAASYNGGEINMTRWLARSKSNLPERYVPEIVFSQSKDYVYKVMANYRVYQIFFDEKLKPKM